MWIMLKYHSAAPCTLLPILWTTWLAFLAWNKVSRVRKHCRKVAARLGWQSLRDSWKISIESTLELWHGFLQCRDKDTRVWIVIWKYPWAKPLHNYWILHIHSLKAFQSYSKFTNEWYKNKLILTWIFEVVLNLEWGWVTHLCHKSESVLRGFPWPNDELQILYIQDARQRLTASWLGLFPPGEIKAMHIL